MCVDRSGEIGVGPPTSVPPVTIPVANNVSVHARERRWSSGRSPTRKVHSYPARRPLDDVSMVLSRCGLASACSATAAGFSVLVESRKRCRASSSTRAKTRAAVVASEPGFLMSRITSQSASTERVPSVESVSLVPAVSRRTVERGLPRRGF